MMSRYFAILLGLLIFAALACASGTKTDNTIEPTGTTVINVTSLVPTATIQVPQTTTIECNSEDSNSCVPLVTVATSTSSVLGTSTVTQVTTPLASVLNGGNRDFDGDMPASGAAGFGSEVNAIICAIVATCAAFITVLAI